MEKAPNLSPEEYKSRFDKLHADLESGNIPPEDHSTELQDRSFSVIAKKKRIMSSPVDRALNNTGSQAVLEWERKKEENEDRFADLRPSETANDAEAGK